MFKNGVTVYGLTGFKNQRLLKNRTLGYKRQRPIILDRYQTGAESGLKLISSEVKSTIDYSTPLSCIIKKLLFPVIRAKDTGNRLSVAMGGQISIHR